MTETTETPVAMPETSPRPALALAALLVGLIGLVLAAGAIALPYVPALQRLLPAAPISGEPAPDYTPDYAAAVGLLQHQVAQLGQRIDSLAPAEAPTTDLSLIESRMVEIEQQLAAVSATVSEQREKTQAVQPAGLAFIRLETRLLRGEPFRTQLDLLKQLSKTPLSADHDRDLSAAALGVATADKLVAALREHERAARRAERMATVDGPLDRIWAELQSLVVIRSAAHDAAGNISDPIESLVAAIRHGDLPTTQAAWLGVPAPVKQVLGAVYADIERRQRAELALQQMAPTYLAVQ